MRLFIGIDPGVIGGLVALPQDSRDDATKARIDPMPDGEIATWEWFRPYRDSSLRGGITAVIEQIPTAIFGTDKSSMSKLYGNYMSLRMCLIASGIRFHTVQARHWQGVLGISPRDKRGGETQVQFKSRIKARAYDLFSETRPTLKTCDALLVAEYCRTTYGGFYHAEDS